MAQINKRHPERNGPEIGKKVVSDSAARNYNRIDFPGLDQVGQESRIVRSMENVRQDEDVGRKSTELMFPNMID